VAPDAADVIAARPDPSFETLVRRLGEQARLMAEARVRDERMGLHDPARWRRPDLLWPLFAKG